MPAYSEAEILKALDAAKENGDWPCFGNLKVDYVASRLTAYRDENRWAIVINTIEWASGEINSFIQPIGNCTAITPSRDVVQANEALYEHLLNDPRRKRVMQKWRPGGFFWKLAKFVGVKESDMVDPAIAMESSKQANLRHMAKFLNTVGLEYSENGGAESVTAAMVRGRLVPLAELQVRPQPELNTDHAFWTVAALTDRYREQIYANQAELGRFFPDGLPPRLILLDDWHHEDDRCPSKTETFRLLAKAIYAGDASVYQPAEKSNTHWSNWLPK